MHLKQTRFHLYYLLVLLLLAGPAMHVNAAMVEGLNQGTVVVKDQANATRKRANRDALKQVLVKISGSTALLTHPAIKKRIAQADSLLRSYRFDNEKGQLLYKASFNQQRIEQMIFAAGFPIWDSRRPDSLIWLVSENPETYERSLLSEQVDSTFKQSLVAAANSRGLPITLPLMDLTDLQAINAFDVWGQFTATIESASARYKPEYILAARVYANHPVLPSSAITAKEQQQVNSAFDPSEFSQVSQTSSDEPYALDWTLIRNGVTQSGQLTGADANSLVKQMVAMLADRLAQRYAIHMGGQTGKQKVQIKLVNMSTIEQYIEVSRFLTSLSIVERATLVNLRGAESVFELDMLGQVADLRNILRLDDKIQPRLDEFGLPVSDLEYYWIP